MDTLSETPSKNGSYVVIAACIIAGISLILAIVSIRSVSSLKESIGGNGDLSVRLDVLESEIGKAAGDAKKATARTSNLSKDIQNALNEVSAEMGSIRTELNRLTIRSNGGSPKRTASKPAPKATSAAPSTVSSSSTPSSSAPAVKAPSSGGTYTIASGDTFARIAARSGISLQSLMDANPGVDPRRLAVGQKVIIP